MLTRLAENTSQLKPRFAASPMSISPFLHDRIVLRPMKAPSPIVMPRLLVPLASSRLAKPERPTTSSTYFARLDLPGAKSWDWTGVATGAGRSEPAMGSVPFERPADTVTQAHLRTVADLGARPRDVEGAALREEIDPPPIERRLDPKRRTERFARRPRHPDRPHGQMHPRFRHLGSIRHQLYERVQRRHFPTGAHVGAIGGVGMLPAQHEPIDQVVDVSEMVIDLSAAERDPATAGNATKELQEPAVPGAVDA